KMKCNSYSLSFLVDRRGIALLPFWFCIGHLFAKTTEVTSLCKIGGNGQKHREARGVKGVPCLRQRAPPLQAKEKRTCATGHSLRLFCCSVWQSMEPQQPGDKPYPARSQDMFTILRALRLWAPP